MVDFASRFRYSVLRVCRLAGVYFIVGGLCPPNATNMCVSLPKNHMELVSARMQAANRCNGSALPAIPKYFTLNPKPAKQASHALHTSPLGLHINPKKPEPESFTHSAPPPRFPMNLQVARCSYVNHRQDHSKPPPES